MNNASTRVLLYVWPSGEKAWRVTGQPSFTHFEFEIRDWYRGPDAENLISEGILRIGGVGGPNAFATGNVYADFLPAGSELPLSLDETLLYERGGNARLAAHLLPFLLDYGIDPREVPEGNAGAFFEEVNRWPEFLPPGVPEVLESAEVLHFQADLLRRSRDMDPRDYMKEPELAEEAGLWLARVLREAGLETRLMTRQLALSGGRFVRLTNVDFFLPSCQWSSSITWLPVEQTWSPNRQVPEPGEEIHRIMDLFDQSAWIHRASEQQAVLSKNRGTPLFDTEIYQLLGEPSPIFWSDTDFLQWVRDQEVP